MSTVPNDPSSAGTSRLTRPGWPEILAGGVAYGVSILLVVVLLPLVEDDATAGVVGLFVSGAMGLIAFAVAVLIRIRGLAAFGVRRSKPKYLLIGAALGLAAYAAGIIVTVIVGSIVGPGENVQSTYQAAAAGGALSLIVTLIGGSLITPLGEESFFRGVVANAFLGKFPAWLAIILSAAIFAIAHGINTILPIAFIVGIFAALVFRWSGSLWPGVVLHGVNNAAATVVPLIIAAVAS
jgi:uncharacterized protein